MSDRVKVSILIPTYNYARFLPEAIESVLAQDFGDFEVLISDDASQDDSADLIRAYARSDRRIRVALQPKNLGLVENWNWCLREARGGYIKFLFGDDRFGDARALGRYVALLEAHPTAVLAASARTVITEESQAVMHWSHLGADGLHPGRIVGRRCLLQTENLIGEPTAVIFRANRAGRGFDVRYRQIADLEMWCHLLRTGDLAYTKAPLCQFRRHACQQSEVHFVAGVGKREYVALLETHMEYFFPAGSRLRAAERKYAFECIFDLRKHAPGISKTHAVARLLTPALGRAWYPVFWIRRRLLRPWQNLQHAWHKHIMGRHRLSFPSVPRVPAAPVHALALAHRAFDHDRHPGPAFQLGYPRVEPSPGRPPPDSAV